MTTRRSRPRDLCACRHQRREHNPAGCWRCECRDFRRPPA